MEEVAEQLTFDGLVVATENVEPYVFAIPPDLNAELDGELEVLALVVMKPQSVVETGNGGDADCMFGPSIELDIPGVVMDGGSWVPTGTTVKTLVVDCLPDVADYMRTLHAEEPALTTFDPDDPLALPSLDPLVVEATKWITSHQDGKDELLLCGRRSGNPETEASKKHSRKGYSFRKEARERRKGHYSSSGSKLGGDHGDYPQPCGADLCDDQEADGFGGASVRLPTTCHSTCPAFVFNSWVGNVSSSRDGICGKSFGEQAQDQVDGPAGLLASPLISKPAEVQELEDEKKTPMDGNLAQAVLAQSQAPLRLDLFQQLGFDTGSNWQGKASGGAGTSERHFLSGGAPIHDSENVALDSVGPSPCDPLGERLSGEVWWVWPDEGVGPSSMAGDVHLRPAHGREHPGCERRYGSSCRYPGTRGDGQWEAGHRFSTMPAGGTAVIGFQHEECGDVAPQQGFRSTRRSAVGDGGTKFHEGDGGHRNKAIGVHFGKELGPSGCSSAHPKAKAEDQEADQIGSEASCAYDGDGDQPAVPWTSSQT